MNTYTLTVKDNDGTKKSITLSAKDNEELIMALSVYEKKQQELKIEAEKADWKIGRQAFICLIIFLIILKWLGFPN